jgi:hypothetical protein
MLVRPDLLDLLVMPALEQRPATLVTLVMLVVMARQVLPETRAPVQQAAIRVARLLHPGQDNLAIQVAQVQVAILDLR